MEKTLFAALIGRPNVGKSTLMNYVLGKKVSIVSSKPQTTRTRITGIMSRGDTQYVFLDTPGVHKPQTKLGAVMVKTASSAVGDVDVVLWLVEAGDRIGDVERSLIRRFKSDELPVILLVNKIDESSAEEIGETIVRFSSEMDFAAVIPISAKTGKNVEEIFGEIEDEHDSTNYVAKKLDNGEYLLSARLEIEKVNEMFDLDLPDSDEYMTVGGLILHEYQSFPKLNEVVKIGHLEFKIIKNTATKIELVRLKVAERSNFS